jgi:GNAT superfamily N-acetyltransferase
MAMKGMLMSANQDNLVRLTGARIEQATETAVRAFYDYPLTVYFTPDPTKRRGQMSYGFRSLLHFGIKFGEVYVTSPKVEGLAVWLPSENADKTLWRQIRSFNLSALTGLFRKKPAAQRAFSEYTRAVRQRRAPVPYMYLQLLAVDPACQGRGYSSLLLRYMFARIDEGGLPCFLETQTEKNVGIYEHFGFRVVEEGMVPGSKIRSWAMLREKR